MQFMHIALQAAIVREYARSIPCQSPLRGEMPAFFLGRICCFVTLRCELFNYCELLSPHWKLQEVRIHGLCIVTLEEMLGNFIQYFSWYRQVSSFGSFASRSLWKSRSWMVGGSARLWMVNCWRWNANLERLERSWDRKSVRNRSQNRSQVVQNRSQIGPRAPQTRLGHALGAS